MATLAPGHEPWALASAASIRERAGCPPPGKRGQGHGSRLEGTLFRYNIPDQINKDRCLWKPELGVVVLGRVFRASRLRSGARNSS